MRLPRTCPHCHVKLLRGATQAMCESCNGVWSVPYLRPAWFEILTARDYIVGLAVVLLVSAVFILWWGLT